VKAVQEVQDGKFIPDRENDVLTKALRNVEHTGRTRGLGPNYPWRIGFAKDVDSYRSQREKRSRRSRRRQTGCRNWKKKYDGMFKGMH
jgi:hypothetical protein